MTGFGATLLDLMHRHDISTWKDLSDMLEENGYCYTPQRISNWTHGRHAVSNDFTEALRDTLNLDAEESVRLALAFAYWQNTHVEIPTVS